MTEHYDAIVIGGGFAGIYHLYMLRKLGFKVHLYDAAPDFGGIWRLNCVSPRRVADASQSGADSVAELDG